jgi:hypothetical protein
VKNEALQFSIFLLRGHSTEQKFTAEQILKELEAFQ